MSYIDANFEVLYALVIMVILALFTGGWCYMMGYDSGFKESKGDSERRAWNRENSPIMRLVKLYEAVRGANLSLSGPFSSN